VALLSRYPVRRWFDVRLPALRSPVPMRVARGRLSLVRDEPRVGLVAEVASPGGPMTVIATHLSFVPWWNQLQLRRLVQAVDALPGECPQLLLGDLNTPRPRAALRLGWRPLVRALTFPASMPDRQLDHILGRGDLPAVTACEARAMPLSDHRAMVADLGQEAVGR
jgi:endonuclease/exonuclease/phosphatase family metal-dependent hydrolase